jgi:dolichyl-phosphate beta-glucosyltransferase
MNNWPHSGGTATTSLIFPTYNPGPILQKTWSAVKQFLDQTSENWEVVFVCDGCTDGSSARLQEWAASHAGQVRVLSYAPNRGKGYAVRYGLAAARGQWRLFTDVDLAYGFDDIERVAWALRNGAAAAIASRRHPESTMLIPARLLGYAYRRHLQSLVFSWLVRRILALKHRDTQAGLKGLSAEAARRLLPKLTCNGFGFDCELLTVAAHLGVPVVEVPVCVRLEDHASTTSLTTLAAMLGELWQIRRACKHLEVSPAEVVTGRRAA